MTAGYRGTFVIPVDQTESDGLRAAPIEALAVGSVWVWWGEAVRVDGPAQVLLLDGAPAQAELRRRAARSAARLLGARRAGGAGRRAERRQEAPAAGFTVTDGTGLFDLVPAGPGLLGITGALPPRGVELAVVDLRAGGASGSARAGEGGVVCFTPGARIATPEGPRAVEEIRPGDRVSTRDGGGQEVLWAGARRISGARLHAMPWLRPVRIRAGAFGPGWPSGDLLVSPDHRILVSGAAARDLFGEAEVLVAARDLIDGSAIVTDSGLREVTYLHLLTSQHEVTWANGLAAETFHPAAADLGSLDPGQRAGLLAAVEGLAGDPSCYGSFARRSLTMPEAALLRHAAA
ncbi:Hint domain-containing protein [Albidovulum sp.]|jgi:hypothetical protein|uniref:Hint domain-containing protein n=1 Tax=Albidovulum sp. TaxID=1872424 RepID=UPI0030372010